MHLGELNGHLQEWSSVILKRYVSVYVCEPVCKVTSPILP